MCRSSTPDTVGRRCPNCGGRTYTDRRENAKIRKRRSVAGKALRAALSAGTDAEVRTAEAALRAIPGGNATAARILATTPRTKPEQQQATTAPADAPVQPAAEPEATELTQTKTLSGPAAVDRWLRDLQSQGYVLTSVAEEQAGRGLRVTARFRRRSA